MDDSRSTAYVYDYNGTRVNKYTARSETLYFNQFYAMRFDNLVGYGNGQSVKHIYLGDTRIVTKLNTVRSGTWSEEVKKQYFYHSDHLGSASLISDSDGKEYQRIEYTPYGETWVEKTQNTGMEYLPYKFTGKERDEETGLYYFGARYLDPQYSRWLSTDPALGDYVPQAGGDNSKLPNGGAYNFINFSLYHYGANNPVRYTDPTGAYDVDDETKTIYCDINDSADVHSAYKAFAMLSHLDGYKSCVATDSTTGSSITFNSTQAMGQTLEAMRTDDGTANLSSLLSIASDVATVGGVISPEAFGKISNAFSYAGIVVDFVNLGKNIYNNDAYEAVNSGVDVAINAIGLAGPKGAIASIGLKYTKIGLEVGAEKMAEANVKFSRMAEAYIKDKMFEQIEFRHGR